MIFLFVVPIMAGFGNYFVPLMIGARDMAFPKLNALSFWLLAAGGIVFYASIFFSPPECGWTCYTPLIDDRLPALRRRRRVDLPDPPHGPELAGRRDQLLRDDRQHARARHGLGPPAAVRLGDPDLRGPADPRPAGDRRRRHAAADRPPLRDALLRRRRNGGSPLLWQHLFWFFGHPEVYIMVLPGFGIISEVLPVFARKPIFGYKAIAAATRGHRLPRPARVGPPHVRDAEPGASCSSSSCSSSFLIAVPTGVKIFNWIATLWRGTIEFTTALLFCRRLHRHVPDRRHHRHLPRRLPGRLAAARHLLRRRPLPLRADGRRGLRDLRRASTTGSRR